MPRMRAIDSVGRIHIYDIKDMAWVDDTGFVESSAATDGGEDGRMLQHPSRLLFFFHINPGRSIQDGLVAKEATMFNVSLYDVDISIDIYDASGFSFIRFSFGGCLHKHPERS